MNAEHYFNFLDESICNIASKADLFLFEGKISKKDQEELIEDCVILSCFYTATFREKPPFLLEFLEKDTVGKMTKKERSQMGAFFTPRYIADYMVKSVIGPSMKNKTIKEILDLKILDPAMGGAIFLVSAHNFLMSEILKMDYEDNYNIEELADKALKCLHGVDINPRAVEFSKMVLSLNNAKWKTLNKLDEYVNSVR